MKMDHPRVTVVRNEAVPYFIRLLKFKMRIHLQSDVQYLGYDCHGIDSFLPPTMPSASPREGTWLTTLAPRPQIGVVYPGFPE